MNALRKRELLLSMKYCTIEACFSVPMLNLTTGNLPFAIGFAIKVLGWKSAAVGLLAATPFLCLFLQPPITYLLHRFFSLYEIMFVGFLVNALPWTLIGLFPWLGEHTHWVFAAIVMVSTLGNAICGVAWSASVSELVPLGLRGRFFGTRNLIFGFWTLVVVLAAGQIVDAYDNSIQVFGIIFTLASAARLIGLFFLTRMKFPPTVTQRQKESAPLSTFLDVFKDLNFVRLLLFTGLFGLCLNLGAPFYSVYVLRELPFSVGDLTILTTLSTLGGLLSMKTWGSLSDRFGNKPIMMTSALIWLVTAAISWLVAGPTRYLHLYGNYFLTGFMIAGFQQLGQFGLMIKMVPAQNKAHYLSVYFSFTNMLVALGPIIGGAILQFMPREVGTFLGQPVTKFQLCIVGSLGLCILTLHLLQSIREPAERPVRELIAVMRQMREFNPFLGLATLAHYMFTPRGLGRLAHFSVRTFRRQTNAVSDVGEELMENGLRVITQPFRREDEEEEEIKNVKKA